MTTSPPPMPAAPAPAPGWWSRNWLWCVPAIVVTGAIFLAGFLFMVISLVFGAMKSSEPYKDSVAKALADPKVREALGTPVKDGFFFTGNINVTNDSGRAELDIPLEGPKNNGRLHVEGNKSGGVWTYTVREVTISNSGEKISLGP